MIAAALLGACAGEVKAGSGAACPAPPATADGLSAWLEAGCYRDWPGDPAPRPAEMTPGTVRVFRSPLLDDSVAPHPTGSAAVREMYSKDGALLGWSATIKQANGWYWFERFVTSDQASVAGTTAPGCQGCHSHAEDNVQSLP